MARYRKKPVVVEAEQWFASQDPETYPEGMRWDGHIGAYTIESLSGPVKVDDGDWIITEQDGVHHYPCKPDVFQNTYERVEEGATP